MGVNKNRNWIVHSKNNLCIEEQWFLPPPYKESDGRKYELQTALQWFEYNSGVWSCPRRWELTECSQAGEKAAWSAWAGLRCSHHSVCSNGPCLQATPHNTQHKRLMLKKSSFSWMCRANVSTIYSFLGFRLSKFYSTLPNPSEDISAGSQECSPGYQPRTFNSARSQTLQTCDVWRVTCDCLCVTASWAPRPIFTIITVYPHITGVGRPSHRNHNSSSQTTQRRGGSSASAWGRRRFR